VAVIPDPIDPWQLILCGPMSADRTPVTVVGALPFATNRRFDFALNRPEGLSFRMPMDAPHALDLLTYTDGVILLTYNGTLVMVTEIQTVEIVGEGEEHSVAVNAMSSMWVRFSKALIGDTAAGRAGPTSATDQGTWLKTDVLATYNAKTFSGVSAHTWIGTGGTTTASGNITGGIWRFKPFIELIQELSATTAGFDFWQDYVDPRSGSVGTALAGNLSIAPLKGTTKTNVVIEYGTQNPNADSYRFLTDTSNMITRAVSLPPDFPDNRGLKIAAVNDATRAAVVGYRQELIQNDLSDTTLRTNLAQEHLDVRKVPRKLFTIQPAPQDNSGRIPVALTDYVVGDTIRGRVIDHGVTMVDANVRVYGISITPGEEGGMQKDELTLVSEA
jgi:hypothetical protein